MISTKSNHPMQHPIHFHKQRFLVLEKDSVMTMNIVWKDRALLPIGSSDGILPYVTNHDGDRMTHCHTLEHFQ